MESDRREAWRAAATRAESCRTRTAALQAGYSVTAADIARASVHLSFARARAERARLALREARASRTRQIAFADQAAAAVRLAEPPSSRLTAEEFSAWLRERGRNLAEVMVHYLSIGGTCSSFELDAFVNSMLELPDVELVVLGHAIWEMDEFQGTI
jgi:hypothetical protein